MFVIEWPPITNPKRRPDKVYIRFGRWSLRSYNHATDEKERGVSVYNARFTSDGLVELLYDTDPDAKQCRKRLSGRVAFVVTGEVAGYGSDREPLLRRIKNLPYAIAYESMPNLKEFYSVV